MGSEMCIRDRMKDLANARSKTSTLDLAILAALNIAQELLELKSDVAAKDRAEGEKIQRLVVAIDKDLQGVEK